MADAKRYSVSITNGDAIATANASAVYSTGTVYKAYNLVNKVEGDSPSNSPKVATAPSSTGDVTGLRHPLRLPQLTIQSGRTLPKVRSNLLLLLKVMDEVL